MQKRVGAVPKPAAAWRWREMHKEPLISSQCGHPIEARLEPRPHAQGQSNLTRVALILAHQGGGLAKAPVIGEADVGGKPATDFVPQPSPKFEIVEPRPGRELLDALDGGIGFEPALEDQSLRQ